MYKILFTLALCSFVGAILSLICNNTNLAIVFFCVTFALGVSSVVEHHLENKYTKTDEPVIQQDPIPATAHQAAYPTELKLSNSADKGFTKYEIVLRDFTAAILSNPVFCADARKEGFHELLLDSAHELTSQYFKTLQTCNNTNL